MIYRLTFLFLIGFSLLSCSTTENNGPDLPERLFGTWNATSMLVNTVETINTTPETTSFSYEFASGSIANRYCQADTVTGNFTTNDDYFTVYFNMIPNSLYVDTLNESRLVVHGEQNGALIRQSFDKQ